MKYYKHNDNQTGVVFSENRLRTMWARNVGTTEFGTFESFLMNYTEVPEPEAHNPDPIDPLLEDENGY